MIEMEAAKPARTIESFLANITESHTSQFLQLLIDTPVDIPLRVIGVVENERHYGKLLLWPAENTWNVWFVGYKKEDIPRKYLARPVDATDLVYLRPNYSAFEHEIGAKVVDSEAHRRIEKALKEIGASEERLRKAEDRFRAQNEGEKVRGVARARAELMPIRKILLGD